jgi:hypothetical protein
MNMDANALLIVSAIASGCRQSKPHTHVDAAPPLRSFSDSLFQRFKNSFSDSLKLSNSFSDSHFSQFSQEKIISRKEFPAKITRTDVFFVIYRNSPMLP